MAVACAPATIEATPILGPSRNTMAMSTLSFESWLTLIPHPKDLSPRIIDGNFISLFVGSRKCQETYPKTRKVKGFYEVMTVEKKDILGDAPPSSSAREV
jgi:hypothetical protein